jgi:large subunit ribosomal protein L35
MPPGTYFRRRAVGYSLDFMGVISGSDCRQQETEMPKMKTKQAAAKRFTMTASGKLKRGVAGKRHRLISHNAKYIRTNRGTVVVSEADTPRVKKQFLPNGVS